MEGDRWVQKKLKSIDWKKVIKNFIIGLILFILLFCFNIGFSEGDFRKLWGITVFTFNFTKNNFKNSNIYKIINHFS